MARRVGRLFVVAIGISRDDRLGFTRLAVPDAKAVSEALAASSKGPFNEISVQLLTDEGATAERITQTFEELVRVARPDDSVFVFFSGNTLFTSDASMTGDPSSVEQTVLLAHGFAHATTAVTDAPRPGVIPARLLGAWLSRVSALRQIVVLDADNTRPGLDDFTSSMTERDVLLGDASTRSKLIVGLVGSAFESPKLKHGLLTTALLRGLAGAADVGPAPDGVISALELEVSLPRLYLEVVREASAPRSFGGLRTVSIGDDFPLARPGPVVPAGGAEADGGSRGLRAAPTAEKPRTKRAGINRALFFATDEYQHERWPRLSNPIFDARALRDELETNFGFEVALVENADFVAIREKLDDYRNREFGEDDQLLVFFAGHGTYDEKTKQGYIIAHDSAPYPKVPAIPWPAMSNTDLRELVDVIPCRHILVVLDTCFGGTFDARLSGAGAGHRGGDLYADVETSEIVRRVLTYRARLYLTSGGKEYVPDGRPGQHSPFARGLLEGLRTGSGRKGLVTWNDLKNGMRGLKTEPRAGEFSDSEPGADFLFLLKPR